MIAVAVPDHILIIGSVYSGPYKAEVSLIVQVRYAALFRRCCCCHSQKSQGPHFYFENSVYHHRLSIGRLYSLSSSNEAHLVAQAGCRR